MIPSIFPGAKLEVSMVKIESVQIGDILCYLGQGKEIVTHRVVHIEMKDNSRFFFLRGDAQEKREQVPASAIVYRVTRVKQRFLSYETTGIVGKLLSQFAVLEGSIWSRIRHTVCSGCSYSYHLWTRLNR